MPRCQVRRVQSRRRSSSATRSRAEERRSGGGRPPAQARSAGDPRVVAVGGRRKIQGPRTGRDGSTPGTLSIEEARDPKQAVNARRARRPNAVRGRRDFRSAGSRKEEKSSRSRSAAPANADCSRSIARRAVSAKQIVDFQTRQPCRRPLRVTAPATNDGTCGLRQAISDSSDNSSGRCNSPRRRSSGSSTGRKSLAA